MYYYTCPDCHSNLDPGEVCDCKKEKQPQENECCPSFKSCVTSQIADLLCQKSVYHKNGIKSSASARGRL